MPRRADLSRSLRIPGFDLADELIDDMHPMVVMCTCIVSSGRQVLEPLILVVAIAYIYQYFYNTYPNCPMKRKILAKPSFFRLTDFCKLSNSSSKFGLLSEAYPAILSG